MIKPMNNKRHALAENKWFFKVGSSACSDLLLIKHAWYIRETLKYDHRKFTESDVLKLCMKPLLMIIIIMVLI